MTPQHEEAQRWPLVKQALEAAFRLKLHEEMKDTSIYVLRRLDGQQPKLRITATEGKSGYWNPRRGEVELHGSSVATIARLAQLVLGEEAFDDTGLAGRSDFELRWDASRPSSLMKLFASN